MKLYTKIILNLIINNKKISTNIDINKKYYNKQMKQKENIKLAIIDIDGLFYQSCRDTIENSIQIFKEKFQNILDKTKVTHYVGFYSNSKYFRHHIDPNYKSNRKKSKSSLWLKALKNWAIIEYNFQYMDNIEADDLCAYWMNKDIVITEDNYIDSKDIIDSANEQLEITDRVTYQVFEKILSSPDKDLLQYITGHHFNYTYKLTEEAKQGLFANINYNIEDEDVTKGWWVETSLKESHVFYAKQLLMGDSADGVHALNGVGTKRADKILENWTESNIESFILNIYIKFYKGDVPKAIFEFQKNYRLLHMLNCDEDFIREIDEIPDFPIIVKTEQKNNDNNIKF